MKKLLRNIMLVATAILMASNISAQAALYAVGGSAALGSWNPANPAEFTYSNGVYTLELDEASSSFKISTSKGSWDQFNAGNLTPNAAITNGGTVKLSVNKDGGDIMLPWTGVWTITVDLNAMTFKAVTETPEPDLTGAPLYMTGNDGSWNPGNPLEIPYDETKGAYYRSNVVFTNQNYEMGGSNHYGATCKISRTKGSWDQFNAKGMCSSDDKTIIIGTPGSLYLQYCGNIPIERDGTFDVTIDLVKATILLEGSSASTTFPDALFLCGNLVDANWDPSFDGAILDPTDDEGVYTVSDIELIPEGTNTHCYFSFNTTTGSWDDVNKAARYGATSKDEAISVGQSATVTNGGSDPNAWMILPGIYNFTVNLKNMTLVVEASSSSIESIKTDNNAPAIYYNLQGVEVENPENGVYIMKQGNKVTKVVK